jgi:hypothetical protein
MQACLSTCTRTRTHCSAPHAPRILQQCLQHKLLQLHQLLTILQPHSKVVQRRLRCAATYRLCWAQVQRPGTDILAGAGQELCTTL